MSLWDILNEKFQEPLTVFQMAQLLQNLGDFDSGKSNIKLTRDMAGVTLNSQEIHNCSRLSVALYYGGNVCDTERNPFLALE